MKAGDRVEVRFNSHFYLGDVVLLNGPGTKARVQYQSGSGAPRDRWFTVYESRAALEAAPGGGCAPMPFGGPVAPEVLAGAAAVKAAVTGTGARGGDSARVSSPSVQIARADELRSEIASHLSMARAQLKGAAVEWQRSCRGYTPGASDLGAFVYYARRVEAAALALAQARIAWASLADAVGAQS